MSEWDKGAYGKVILEGDIHTTNQKAAGLESRAQAKTFIYGGILYGAGNAKIGSIVGGTAADGKRLKEQFLKGLPALKHLQDYVLTFISTGKLTGLDGRFIPIRHKHAALNSLLQSCGAILAKRWVVIFHSICKAHGYLHGKDYQQVAWVHDEIQVLVKEGTGDEFGKYAQDAMRQTGEYYSFGIRLDADYNIGKSWAETH
jgi:DNA polymerase I-like protein with 3'-5' exonuclease and polymerase domains